MTDTNEEEMNIGPAPNWQTASAFNLQRQYDFISRAAFYANISGEYYQYMSRWVRNALYWYDGYVPFFHDPRNGVFSTKIGQALVNGAAKKVIGGRIFFKNVNREHNGAEDVNSALKFIATDWADKAQFRKAIKQAVTFAAAAGTSLLKLNRDDHGLWAEAQRFDSFYPVVGPRGKLLEVYSYIRCFTQTANAGRNGAAVNAFYIVEHRFFGNYKHLDGTISKNVPLCEYIVKRSSGTVTNGNGYSITRNDRIPFREIERGMRSDIAKAYIGVQFDTPIILPFEDHLGAVLVNWTDSISALPELPFGESLLSGIEAYLQSYDFYYTAFCTDLYIGRGKVLVPDFMTDRKDDDNGYYSDDVGKLMFRKIPKISSDEQTPVPVQFDLRAEQWQAIRTTILQNIAINTRLNISTIASFLDDTNGTKTAREISTEDNETALFVDDKREIIEKPINELLKLVLRYYGYADDVAIRWSQTGLTNIYTRTELINMAVNSGFCSRLKAVQMFNMDDDEEQVMEEYRRCEEDNKHEQADFGYGAGGYGEQYDFNDDKQPDGGNPTSRTGDKADDKDGVFNAGAKAEDRQED